MKSEHVVEANARTNRWVRRLAAAVALLLLGIASIGLEIEIANLHAAARQRAILVDCTTPGTKPPPATGHACYDRGVKATAGAIDDIRRSLDCVALYAIGQTPDPCHETDVRMDQLRAGQDPFRAP